MSTDLKQYKGPLETSRIVAGMNAAAMNARRLANDARILVDSGGLASGASLAALAIEEAGKVSILRELALARNQEDLKDAWKRYRSHRSKNTHWILPQLAASGASNLEELRQVVDPKSDHPALLDRIKQIGFYTDCLGEAHWSIPAEVIDESLAMYLVSTAELLSPSRQFTELEVELWKKHVGPVWKGDMRWMKKALVQWGEDMVANGLMDDSEKFKRFVNAQPKSNEA
ncbi:AbiV family abortive infection protein [Desulfonatronovibrio hydrogenovorans]|uniref:AbiV family abortive infection protein n=2 Tax=Desulfonatronovibrio hydrogenovorans TaxID=53245 RepID=UPI000491A72B